MNVDDTMEDFTPPVGSSVEERDIIRPLEEQYDLPKDTNTKEQEIVGRLRHALIEEFFEGLNEQSVEFEQAEDPRDTEEC